MNCVSGKQDLVREKHENLENKKLNFQNEKEKITMSKRIRPTIASSMIASIASPIPAWYTIPEIPFPSFLELLHPIYKRMNTNMESKSEEDPLFRMVFQASQGMNDEEFDHFWKQQQMAKRLQMAMGDFHQNLMGLFAGWENYKQGHETKCDIGKKDGTIICEIKNNINTMNSDSLRSVTQKLQKQAQLGKEARIIIVNGNIPRKEKDGIVWMSGKDFYQEQSGRPNFMQSVQETMYHVFSTHDTIHSLQESV